MTPEVSIIVRTFNEERRLPALLDGVTQQDHPSFETIVVDSGSFDQTLTIAKARADKVIQIRPSDFTFGFSINEGVRHARGRFIAVVSAHTRPTGRSWLSALTSPLRDSTVAMVYGQQRGTLEESKFSEYMDFIRTFGTFASELRPPNFFANNANAAIRKDLWSQHQFDETLPGLEDAAWAKHWLERGFRVLYEPQAGIFHIHDETWAQVRRRYYREAQAARWLLIRRRRDIPVEIAREAARLMSDLRVAVGTKHLRRKTGEIARFRYEKARGTAEGIWSAAFMDNPAERQTILFGATHRAFVVEGPGVASVREVSTPTPRPGEVLIRVAYVGICATDLEILDGELGYYKTGQAAYPIVPGHEFSGVVAQVGSRVQDFKPGDNVVVECIQGCGSCSACAADDAIRCESRREVGVIRHGGGCQQYMVSEARFVHRLPESVALRDASLVEPLAVVMKALRRLDAVQTGPRRRIAVIGAGTIGHLMTSVLRSKGTDVTVFDRSAERLHALRDLGAEVSPWLSEIEVDPGGVSRS